MNAKGTVNPFPGLRPFNPEEAELFFGRDRQCDELVRRLAERRLLAVVGSSGSGKSSLVKAGLLPALEGGLLAAAGSRWRMAWLRPQDDPIRHLAQALIATGCYEIPGLETDAVEAVIETTLRRSSLGLVEAARLARLPPHENLLVLVDQFEELFRFADLAKERGAADDAPAFVKLLLEAAAQRELPIYVAITMRSDFLGDCARFRDLPEAVSTNQYLVPRLTRDELRSVITGPVGVRGARIEASLVQRLLNEVGDDPDQLPVLQHALHRAWDHWVSAGGASTGPEGAGRPIGESDLDAVGGMAQALSQHADEAYALLASDADRALAARIFKRLTEREPSNREIRRPTSVAELAAVAGVEPADVIRVAEMFRSPGRSFLMPPANVPLTAQQPLDITHESFIRQWGKLRTWVDEEAASRDTYLQLVYAARLNAACRGGLWGEPDLSRGRAWLQEAAPNPAWASRYGPGLDQALAFLGASEAHLAAELEVNRQHLAAQSLARERELAQAHALARAEKTRGDEQVMARKQQRRLSVVLIATLLVAIIFGAFGWIQKRHAADALHEVQQRERLAVTARLVATATATRATDPELSVLIALKALESPADLATGEQDALADALSGAMALSRVRASTLVGDGSKKLSMISYSADGSMIATEGPGNEAVIRDSSTLEPLMPPIASGAKLAALAFAPTAIALAPGEPAKQLLAMVRDRAVVLQVPGEAAARLTLIHTGPVVGLDFSRDGRRLVTAQEEGQIQLWALPSGTRIAMRRGFVHKYVQFIALSPDANAIATASTDGRLILWDARSGTQRELRQGRDFKESPVRFSPDGRFLAVGGLDGNIKLWDPKTGAPLRTTFGHFNTVFDIDFSANSKRFVTASADSTVGIYDSETGRAVYFLRGHNGPVQRVRFSPDQESVASVGWDGRVRVWNVGGLLDKVTMQAFSADGERLMSANPDGTVPLWDAATGNAIATGYVGNVSTVALSREGELMATGTRGGELLIWRSLKRLHSLADHGTDELINVAFSADAKRLVSVSDNQAIVWDVESGHRLRSFEHPFVLQGPVALNDDGSLLATADSSGAIWLWRVDSEAPPRVLDEKSEVKILKLAFNGNGHMLAASGDSGQLRVWNLDVPDDTPLELKHEGPYLFSFAFAPDGTHLVSGEMNGSATIWDLARPADKPVELIGHTAGVDAVAFSADGQRVVTASWDHSARVWDASNGKLLSTLTYDREVLDAAFSSDGRRLTTITADGTPRVHFFDIDKLKSLARGRVTRQLSPDECKRYFRDIPCP
ncbi:MAG: WD40 repeat domain-containing protein [Rubrivivax sp.]